VSEYLQRRFAERIADIEALSKNDATFREICSDYEEASAWMADHCHSGSPLTLKCDRYRELVGELEGEIIEALKDAVF